MKSKIIKLISGARYEIKGGNIYSLNYGEKGMTGCSLGKRLPSALGEKILKTYKEESKIFLRREKSFKKKKYKARRKNERGRKGVRGITLGSVLD